MLSLGSFTAEPNGSRLPGSHAGTAACQAFCKRPVAAIKRIGRRQAYLGHGLASALHVKVRLAAGVGADHLETIIPSQAPMADSANNRELAISGVIGGTESWGGEQPFGLRTHTDS